jgi:hypothetical protein
MKWVTVFLLLVPLVGWGITFEVSTSEEFQAALSAAAGNGGADTIVMAPGVYVGNFRYKGSDAEDLIIQGTYVSEDERTVIDGNREAYVLWIQSGFDGESIYRINDLEIRNGLSLQPGGGLRVDGIYDAYLGNLGQVFLKGISFLKNSTPYEVPGAAIFLYALKSVSIEESFFIDNGGLGTQSVSVVPEGGLPLVEILDSYFFENGPLRLDNATVAGSKFYTAQGPIFQSDSNLAVTDSYFEDTRGAQLTGEVNSPRIGQTESFVGNRVLGFRSTICVLRSSIVERNHFAIESGTVLCDVRELRNNIISVGNADTIVDRYELAANNKFEGGNTIALVADPGSVTLSNSIRTTGGVGISVFDDGTYGRNKATEIRGNTVYSTNKPALRLRPGSNETVSIYNNIFWSESPADAETVEVDRYFELYGDGFEILASNNILGSAPSEYFDDTNLRLDPKFYDLESGDLHVLSDSPAINAGLNSEIGAESDTDLDGNPRILDGIVDIGAYERNTAGLHPADSNGDSIISSAEFEAYNTAWRANDTWPTEPKSITADFVTRAGYLLQRGGEYKNIGVGKPATWVPVNE